MKTTQSGPPATRLWRNANYLFWLGADSSQMLGMALYSFLMPLIALAVLDDPAAAGTIAAAGQVARVITILPGGVLSDRHDRRRLMVLAGLAGVAVAAVFVFMQSLDRLEFWALLAISIAMGVRNGLLGGVSNTALKSVVNTPQLPTALSANQARDGAIQLGAAPAGGAILAIGPLVALVVPLVAFLLSALSALGIRVDLHPRARRRGGMSDDQPGIPTGDGHESPAVGEPVSQAGGGAVPEAKQNVVSEAIEGLRWPWHQPALRGALLVSAAVNVGTNGALMTLIFAFQQRGVSPSVIGLLTSALGGAMIVGAMLAPPLVKRMPTGRLTLLSIGVITTAVVTLAWLDSVPGTIAVFGLGFLLVPAINAGLIGYFMAKVPQRLMGRSLNALNLFAMGAVPLAPVIAGFGLGSIGLRGTLLICAGFCLLSAVLVLASRELRALPTPEGWNPDES